MRVPPNQEKTTHQMRRQKVKMILKPITQKWAKALHSKNFLGLDACISAGRGPLIFGTSNSMMQRVKENLNFAESFLKIKSEIRLEALNLVVVKSFSPILGNLELKISPQIDVSFRPSSTVINFYLSLFKSYIGNTARILKPLRSYIYLNNRAIQKIHKIFSIPRFLKDNKLSNWYQAERNARRGQISNYEPRPSLRISTIDSKDKNIVPSIKHIESRKSIRCEFSRLRETLNIFRRTTLTKVFRSLYVKRVASGHVHSIQELHPRKELYTLKDKIINLIHLHSHDIYRSKESIHKNLTARLIANNEGPSRGDRTIPINLAFIKMYRDQYQAHLHRTHSMFYPASLELITRKIQTVEKQVSREEVEKTISEKVFNRLDKTIEERVHKQLTLYSDYTRQLTENIYSQLFNRIVLERERLGRV